MTRLPRSARRGWSRCCYDKTSLAQISAGDLSDAVMALLPWDLRARLDREAPTHFEAPTGTQVAIDYEAEQGPTIAIRVQELFGLNTHPGDRAGKGAAGGRASVAGASAGAGDPRSAGFLARQLCRRARRPARPLSAPSLAGRSGQRARRPGGRSREGREFCASSLLGLTRGLTLHSRFAQDMACLDHAPQTACALTFAHLLAKMAASRLPSRWRGGCGEIAGIQ